MMRPYTPLFDELNSMDFSCYASIWKSQIRRLQLTEHFLLNNTMQPLL